MLTCTICDTDMAGCTCPDRDEKLKALAFDPNSCIAFKWCRKCDKHYARCKCEEPEFYAVYRGQDITGERLHNHLGQTVRPDLTKR